MPEISCVVFVDEFIAHGDPIVGIKRFEDLSRDFVVVLLGITVDLKGPSGAYAPVGVDADGAYRMPFGVGGFRAVGGLELLRVRVDFKEDVFYVFKCVHLRRHLPEREIRDKFAGFFIRSVIRACDFVDGRGLPVLRD